MAKEGLCLSLLIPRPIRLDLLHPGIRAAKLANCSSCCWQRSSSLLLQRAPSALVVGRQCSENIRGSVLSFSTSGELAQAGSAVAGSASAPTQRGHLLPLLLATQQQSATAAGASAIVVDRLRCKSIGGGVLLLRSRLWRIAISIHLLMFRQW